MQIYNINFKSHFRLSKTALLYTFIAAISILIVLLQNKIDTAFIVKIILAITIILNGPAFFLHFSYYLENKNWIIKEYEEVIEIYMTNEKCIKIDKNNIISIDVYMAPSFINYGTTTGLPTEDYHVVKFTIKDEEIIITNLIYQDIKKLSSKFVNIKPQFNKTIFANF